MGNKEQVEIIRQGVEDWNLWREQRVGVSVDLSHYYLKEMDLTGANLIGAYLVGTEFTGSTLAHSMIRGANLRYADLTDCDLSNADFYESDLTETILKGADFSNAWIGLTTFANNDLREVKGLETVNHRAPSSIGIDTIYESKGNVPEVFLRRAGIPSNFITYMASLTRQAFQYYSCFISFTESDDIFSERLYNDLQAAGLRCWRWKEDAKWGRTLMLSIDEAVRVYDKLIVICSESSLNSPAVIREIERALQKEDNLARQGKSSEVLFPICLDKYIFGEWNHHRKADVLAKNVGDFSRWNQPEVYRKNLNRLLRDLKREES